jgi:hypothetical protein
MSDLYSVDVEALPGNDSIFITLTPVNNDSDTPNIYSSEFPREEELLTSFIRSIGASTSLDFSEEDHYPSLARNLIQKTAHPAFCRKGSIDNICNMQGNDNRRHEMPISQGDSVVNYYGKNQPNTNLEIEPNAETLGNVPPKVPEEYRKEVVIVESIKYKNGIIINGKQYPENTVVRFYHKGIING